MSWVCPRWRCFRNTTGFLHPLEPLDPFYGSTLETLWSSRRLRLNRTGGRAEIHLLMKLAGFLVTG
uniref:Alternative protein VAV1 n=1 Tax=Homo sapiens TaxID=9606 RepID=L0R6S8_HUMAN|nr:alternative protein VAV1 [Homo sapiens]